MSNIHTVSIKTKNAALLKEILDCDNEAYSKKTSEEEKKRQQNLDKF